MRTNEGMIRDHVAGDLARSPRTNLNPDLQLVIYCSPSSNRVVGQGASGVGKGAGNACGAVIVHQARLHNELARLRPDRKGAGSAALNSSHARGINGTGAIPEENTGIKG